mmetsp:Transcript_32869/g.58901  ORF Transcript_32869/g.58901 Transcript_32869/m.58901 type:complete len:287 (-) Transcript_32869:1630-2490(-)
MQSMMVSLVKMLCFTGGRFMRSEAQSSRAIPIAGPEPVAVLMNRMAIGLSTKMGKPLSSMTKARDTSSTTASAMLPLSRCITKLLMEAKMRRPSRTALTMVAKLSSASTMSATPLVTSEPVIPMAMPTSASLMEGESFTPSPVIAAILPRLCSASTMRTLLSGEQRATMRGSSGILSRSSSLMASILGPVVMTPFAAGPAGIMPISFAMASAVAGWSPVSMRTTIPAEKHCFTAVMEDCLGGSRTAMRARKRRLLSTSPRSRLVTSAVGSLRGRSVRWATARTRRP